MKIILEDKCPSWNQIYSGVHWAVRKKLADEKHELVKWAVYQLKNKPELPIKKKVFIEYDIWYKDKRRHDPDNACIKLYTDGLVESGVLEDDDCNHVSGIGITMKNGMPLDRIMITINF